MGPHGVSARPAEAYSGAVLIAVFVVVEAAYHNFGIHFDASTLNLSWQFLDPELLRHDLFRSIWYFHSQPPAFNLLVGLILKVTGSHWVTAMHLFYVACGLSMYPEIFVLMRQFRASRFLAGVAATAFLLTPSFVLYEHWLFYPFLQATAITLSLVALGRFLQSPSRSRAALLATIVFLLCASQSLYQLPYFIFLLGGIAVAYPRGRRTLLAGAAGPFAVLLAIYLKNVVLFGLPATSSWGGMSIAKMTIGYLAPSTVADLAASGAVSPVALIEPFSGPEAYPDRYFTAEGIAAIPALTAPVKSTGGDNLNHIGYLRISDIYLRDSLVVVRRYPKAFIAASVDAWKAYFWSTSDVRFLERNRSQIAGLNRVFDQIVYGQWPGTNMYVFLQIALMLAVGLPIVRFSRGQLRSPQESVLLVCAVFNIVYVAIVGNTFEIGENNRFRFATDGLSMTMLLVGLGGFRPLRRLLGGGS